jgi:hypothetical protein
MLAFYLKTSDEASHAFILPPRRTERGQKSRASHGTGADHAVVCPRPTATTHWDFCVISSSHPLPSARPHRPYLTLPSDIATRTRSHSNHLSCRDTRRGPGAMDGASLLANSTADINVFQSPPPQLAPYGFPDPLHAAHSDDVGTTTPPSVPKSKRRKLSAYNNDIVKPDDLDDDLDDSLNHNGSARKSRPAGTKRACNQCRQQKVRPICLCSVQYRLRACQDTQWVSRGHLENETVLTSCVVEVQCGRKSVEELRSVREA